ncbi:unnamed protein product [Urochloa humidicola]
MEQFYDYRMVDDRSVVEQAHDIQALAKESNNSHVCCPISLWRRHYCKAATFLEGFCHFSKTQEAGVQRCWSHWDS